MKRETLTEAQAKLLRDLARRDETVVKGYRSGLALLKRGLAEDLWPHDSYVAKLQITPAGRQALADREAQDGHR